jgi:hypothetical protein
MNNLVIIGNGFDLAHGLKTSYSDFIKHVVDSHYKDFDFFNDLFSYTENPYTYKQLIANIKGGTGHRLGINWKNEFFKNMVTDVAHSNWCDIEKSYYNELINKENKNPKKLNDDFEIIKCYLEDYLEIEKINFKQIPSYSSLISNLKNAENTLILNFNYTDTVSKYDAVNPSLRLVNIHGELKNEGNPIIFGFAADDSQSRDLIGKDNKEYMRNIKKHCYKRTKNQNKLIDYLEKIEKIDVLIFGHSCGISDKLILNQIFNHKNINSIRIFYHENHEAYFETQVNIDRIMNNDKHFEKLINFEESYRMPQLEDSGVQSSDFVKYIDLMLKYQKLKLNGINLS